MPNCKLLTLIVQRIRELVMVAKDGHHEAQWRQEPLSAVKRTEFFVKVDVKADSALAEILEWVEAMEVELDNEQNG